MKKHSFRIVLDESPDTMRKLCLSAKFPHQEIKVNYGILCSDIDLNKQHGLKCTKGNYEGFVKITKESLSELTLWKENLPNMYQKINHEPPAATLYNDASNLGWGSHMRDQRTGGNRSFNEVKYHINIKEMVAVKFALKSFVKEFPNVSIKIFVDNTTVILVLKNMGTSHNFHLNRICKQIWEWCKDRLHIFKLSGC